MDRIILSSTDGESTGVDQANEGAPVPVVMGGRDGEGILSIRL